MLPDSSFLGYSDSQEFTLKGYSDSQPFTHIDKSGEIHAETFIKQFVSLTNFPKIVQNGSKYHRQMMKYKYFYEPGCVRLLLEGA